MKILIRCESCIFFGCKGGNDDDDDSRYNSGGTHADNVIYVK